MDSSIRDRRADVYSQSDVEDVVGYPESDSVSKPEWDSHIDLAWACLENEAFPAQVQKNGDVTIS